MGEDGDGWRPKGAMHEYNGVPIWDHDPGPHEHNDGEFDGDITFDDLEAEDSESDSEH